MVALCLAALLRPVMEELPPAVFARGAAGPFLEGAMEGAGVLKPHQHGNGVDGELGAGQIGPGGLQPTVVLDPLKTGALPAQVAMEGARGHVQRRGHLPGPRQGAAEVLADPRPDPSLQTSLIAARAAVISG